MKLANVAKFLLVLAGGIKVMGPQLGLDDAVTNNVALILTSTCALLPAAFPSMFPRDPEQA